MDLDLIEEISNKQILHFNYRNYKVLPKELKHYGNDIYEIYLKHNQLLEIPKWIRHLVNLRSLFLHGNKIRKLPEEIGELKELTHLDVSWNLLSRLPNSICKLQNLNELILDNNHLQELPEKIGLLSALNVLSIANNFIRRLPSSIGCCFSLQQLIVENNKILFLPNNIVFLPQLNFININENALIYFPSISFDCNPTIQITKNPYLSYISYDLYKSVSDPYTQHANSNFFTYNHESIFQEVMRFEDLEMLHNAVIMIPDWRRYVKHERTYIVLPELLKNIYNMKDNYIPSLFEITLRKIYLSTSCYNRTKFFHYTMTRGLIPENLLKTFTLGPAAKCHYCRTYIFTESLIWVVPKLTTCNICLEAEVLTVLYFCSSSCMTAFKFCEDYENSADKDMVNQALNWIRVH